MPPKVKNTNQSLTADDKELHEELFTAAVRGARTMREIHELLCDGTPIPEYRYGSGNTRSIVLTDAQRIYLNSEAWRGEDREVIDSSTAKMVRDIVKGWPGVIAEVGEPKATDKALSWSVYDLLRISSLATVNLELLDDAISWYAYRAEAKPVS